MNELALRTESAVGSAMSVKDILEQKALIQDAMKAAMIDGQHYGKIPGCGDKPTLLQPGAQTILLLFRFAPDYDITQTDLGNAHREYSVKCRLTSASGNFVGAGVGSCSTMEGKYRFRVAPKTLTDRPVPKGYWDLRKSEPQRAQELIGGRGFSVKKDEDGNWMIAEGSSEKVEHDNPADFYNTCLKMAKKRALVDATLTRTAASDIFTQDLEDLKANAEVYENEPGKNWTDAEAKEFVKRHPNHEWDGKKMHERGKHPPHNITRSADPESEHPSLRPQDIQRKKPAPSADGTPEQRTLMLTALKDIEQDLFVYAVDRGIIMDTEELTDWPLNKVITGIGIEALRKAVGVWKRNQASGTETAKSDGWRGVVVHFGKNKDVPLGALEEKSLCWYVLKWGPKEYNGKISDEDTKFRAALDEAQEELGILADVQ